MQVKEFLRDSAVVVRLKNRMLLGLTIPIPSVKLTLVFLGALLCCAALTRLVLRYQGRLGVDAPDDHRKRHGRTISRLGGLPIFVTLCTGVLLMLPTASEVNPGWWPVLLTNTVVFAIGFCDDLKPLGARVKLLGQIGAALMLYALGQSIDNVTYPTTKLAISLGWLSPLVTVMWLVAVPNIINLIDGMDGLATGFGLFLCLTLAFVGHFAAMPDVVIVCTVMAGALAGFLLFNFPPAKIFLGDGGAYLIGFFVASVSLSNAHKGYILGALLVMVVAMGVPILDTSFAIIRRGIRGLPLFRADAEHIHHRLIELGFSKGQALGILYAACASLSLAGILILTQRGFGLVIAVAGLAVLTLLAARGLGYVKSFRGLRRQLQLALARRREMTYARALGRVLELEADRFGTAAEFSELLARKMGRLGYTLNPEHGRAVGRLQLHSGAYWRVGRTNLDLSEDQWRARLEALLAGVERALKRWKELPGMVLEKAPAPEPKPETKPLSPAAN